MRTRPADRGLAHLRRSNAPPRARPRCARRARPGAGRVRWPIAVARALEQALAERLSARCTVRNTVELSTPASCAAAARLPPRTSASSSASSAAPMSRCTDAFIVCGSSYFQCIDAIRRLRPSLHQPGARHVRCLVHRHSLPRPPQRPPRPPPGACCCCAWRWARCGSPTRCSSRWSSRFAGTAQFFESVGYPRRAGDAGVRRSSWLIGAALVLGVYARQAALLSLPILLAVVWVHIPNGWVCTWPRAAAGSTRCSCSSARWCCGWPATARWRCAAARAWRGARARAVR